MKPLVALFREAWWLWAACYAVAAFLVVTVDWFFLVLFPKLAVVFVYFAYVRFDGDGKPRNE